MAELADALDLGSSGCIHASSSLVTRTRTDTRVWWNWQTRMIQVHMPTSMQVQVLLPAPAGESERVHLLFCFNGILLDRDVLCGGKRIGKTGTGRRSKQRRFPRFPAGQYCLCCALEGTPHIFAWQLPTGWAALAAGKKNNAGVRLAAPCLAIKGTLLVLWQGALVF